MDAAWTWIAAGRTQRPCAYTSEPNRQRGTGNDEDACVSWRGLANPKLSIAQTPKTSAQEKAERSPERPSASTAPGSLHEQPDELPRQPLELCD
eukprot:7775842-Pyramimonas_sp.AAC.1